MVLQREISQFRAFKLSPRWAWLLNLNVPVGPPNCGCLANLGSLIHFLGADDHPVPIDWGMVIYTWQFTLSGRLLDIESLSQFLIQGLASCMRF